MGPQVEFIVRIKTCDFTHTSTTITIKKMLGLLTMTPPGIVSAFINTDYADLDSSFIEYKGMLSYGA